MPKTLNGILLHEQLEWTDRDTWRPVAQSIERTLGGTPVVEAKAIAGRPITLEARGRVSRFTRAQVEAIKVAAATPGAILVLDWDGEVHNVVVLSHQFAPVWPGADWHTGTVRLMEV